MSKNAQEIQTKPHWSNKCVGPLSVNVPIQQSKKTSKGPSFKMTFSK